MLKVAPYNEQILFGTALCSSSKIFDKLLRATPPIPVSVECPSNVHMEWQLILDEHLASDWIGTWLWFPSPILGS